MKFKVGDIIKGKHNQYGVTDERMTEGEVIKIINNNAMRVKVLKHEDVDYVGGEWNVTNSDKEFELVYCKKPTKQELSDMPVGTKIYTDAEDKDYQEWIKTSKYDFYNGENDETLYEDDINNDLTLDVYDDDYGTKIIKIEKPTYETIYDYSAEVQEMTVAEIEEVLGHAVKIIKEDN